ncbi:protein FAM177A1-like [Sinocyclocheilus rhinocerous]|uniref:protein FAM177A1-like n=1 Tax=Sinocyclocheilus rhinocerous TaxID=307959 RepID=UPI0007BA7A34|nr:PREDICTED: protein FAM177A1-like [Sinocyclocheilus rhinocerous]
MAEIWLCLSSVSITVTHDMDPDKSSGKEKEYECVELGDLDRKEKTPRRIIHFSSGETMEEYSTDEEEEDKTQNAKKELLSSIDTSKLTWGPYVWFQMWRAASSTISGKSKEERDEDTRLSEEAEHLFEEQQNDEDEDPETNQPDNNSTQVQMTNELDLHPSFVPNTVHIPARY